MIVEVKGFKIDVQKVLDELMKQLPINVEIEKVDVLYDKFINVYCTPFKPMELGVFNFALKECSLQTFTSYVTQSPVTEDHFWFAIWELRYKDTDGDSNGLQVATSQLFLTGQHPGDIIINVEK
jgi:hypothetical protein